MNLYYELLKYPVFTMDDVQKYYNNINSSRSAVKRLLDKGLVTKIRRNLYTCISGETNAPVANRFQIAGRITSSSCVSHHSAMEYYGITDQVIYDVYVSSQTEFKSFQFDGYSYRFVKSKIPYGIDDVQFSGGVRVTDRERTVLDSIKDMDRIAGVEEVLSNVEGIRRISEVKLVKYLELYDNQFLYQKTGYILLQMQNQLGLSDAFFEMCKAKAGKSTRYFSSDYRSGVFDSSWKLVVPSIVFSLKNGGMNDADV
ncbi:Transcriptional regulator, predicted component of viral defense system [Ruminococcaceae bacterium YRB3002]|nr:Transcriptional regulator, predicted component of viral defense system [Ruminococcaceae bacterium YRB3002]